MRIGSEEHKELFCRSYMESHINYEPETLSWPELDAESLDRLRKVPFWEEALNTELRAGAIIKAYLPYVDDPLVREAIALQGEEESRHGRLFRYLIDFYGVELTGELPEAPSEKVESGFVDFGYGECLDSFLGFGLFKIAREAQFLPQPLFDIFDLLLQEEAKHVVFFVNWVAYLQTIRGRGAGILRGATSLVNYTKAVQRLVALVGESSGEGGTDFTPTEAATFLEDFTIDRLLSVCLAENERRMGEFDPRLLKPSLLPSLARVALSTIRPFTRRKSPSSEAIAS
jgi:hypothetical protein